MTARILFYFSKQKELILDPMAGGGVTPDTCLYQWGLAGFSR